MRPGGMLVGANHGAIDMIRAPVQLALCFSLLLEIRQNAVRHWSSPSGGKTFRPTQRTVGGMLPQHRGSHPDYNAQSMAQIAAYRTLIPSPSPMQARGIMETVAFTNTLQIVARAWHPRVH